MFLDANSADYTIDLVEVKLLEKNKRPNNFKSS
jgi:hypothetical protein